MYMEPQTAVAKWDEGGLIQVTSSTQSADHVQWAVSAALGLPNNKVNVHCRRAGGGFGGKFSRSRPAATAVAVAAYKLRRQVWPLTSEIDFGDWHAAVRGTLPYAQMLHEDTCTAVTRPPARRGLPSQVSWKPLPPDRR